MDKKDRRVICIEFTFATVSPSVIVVAFELNCGSVLDGPQILNLKLKEGSFTIALIPPKNLFSI